MADADGMALDTMRILAERVGLHLSPAELEHLKPMFDFYTEQMRVLHNIDLAAEDLAVVFSPNWDPQG